MCIRDRSQLLGDYVVESHRVRPGLYVGRTLVPCGELHDQKVRMVNTTSTCCLGGITVSSCKMARLQRNVCLLLSGMGALPSMVMVLFLKSHRQPCSPIQSAPNIVSSTSGETDARVRMRWPFDLNGMMTFPVITICVPLAAFRYSVQRVTVRRRSQR